MIDFSFSEKLGQLKDVIMSSPFFLGSLVIGILLLVFMIIGIKKNRKIPKIIFIIAWVFVFVFVIVRYNTSLLYILDRLFGRIIEEIYFPSVTIYTFMLLITNIVFVVSYVKKKMSNLIRIINIIVAMEIDFLFIIILDTIGKNNIDIYVELTAYSNPTMLVLLEFSMFLFLAWIFLLSILLLVKKFAVKTVWVNIFKEEDYEILTIDESHTEEKAEIVDLGIPINTIEVIEPEIDDTEIVDI